MYYKEDFYLESDTDNTIIVWFCGSKVRRYASIDKAKLAIDNAIYFSTPLSDGLVL